MTVENVHSLAKSGQLGNDLFFEGYCLSMAIDACFDTQDVPLAVYSANHVAVAAGEIGQEGIAADDLYELLGALVFKDTSPKDFNVQSYYFTSVDELRTDLTELRGTRTILLDVEDGRHSVGLKPAGDNPDEWQIVGTHQIIAIKTDDSLLDIQCMAEPETITTEQVWEYLAANNSPEAQEYTALIFPPEPS